jgi:hypothetical protein
MQCATPERDEHRNLNLNQHKQSCCTNQHRRSGGACALIGFDADLTLFATKARLSARAWKPTDMESTELLRPALAASESAADAIRQNPEADNANESAINKAEIIAELENMVAARLFSGQPWLADRETISAYHRKLIQMGLVEQVCVEPPTWQYTPLGKEVDIELYQVFIGLW